MRLDQCEAVFAQAAKEFNSHTRRSDGERVAGSLNGGLSLLQDSLYFRLYDDVERIVGKDSMLMPISELKARRMTHTEIAVYQVAESSAAAEKLGCIGPDDHWYTHWLAGLRLGQSHVDARAVAQLTDYLSKTPHQRQLAFTDVLVKVIPDSRRAPLVLFELFPLSVQIVTAMALTDHTSAFKLRRQQLVHQPAIGDCHSCHGEVLENGEQCQACGNPLWKHEWLVAE
jgi:hypothetical protein